PCKSIDLEPSVTTLTFDRTALLDVMEARPHNTSQGQPLRLVNCEVLGVFITSDVEEAIEGAWANRILYARAYAQGFDPEKDKGWRRRVGELPSRRVALVPQ